jgi:hypothetical protein
LKAIRGMGGWEDVYILCVLGLNIYKLEIGWIPDDGDWGMESYKEYYLFACSLVVTAHSINPARYMSVSIARAPPVSMSGV